MANYNELPISTSNADDAADAVAELLTDARLVAHEHLPLNRIAMNSRVTYRMEPDGECRVLTLVHPNEADPVQGRISVLSPIGRALLGRKPGAIVADGPPYARDRSIRVLGMEATAHE